MTTNRPLKVFLCHSSNDKPAVRELYQKLRAESWIEPWLDEEELFPGMDWNLEIEKAIEATDVILVCLSNKSITKEGYVQREIRIALDYADYKPEGTLFIIPVRLEECKPPKRLSRWQYADYFEGQREQTLSRLLVSLKRRADLLGLKIEIPVLKQEENLPEKKQNNMSWMEDYHSKHAKPLEEYKTDKLTLSNGIELMRVHAGKFIMGSENINDYEKPQHAVDIPYDYWMARYPITNELYNAYVESKGIKHPVDRWEKKKDHPVVEVSWNDTIAYCQWLNSLLKVGLPSGLILRLPTEAEWEKAARGSDGHEYPWGNQFDKNICNTREGGKDGTTAVNLYSPPGDSPFGCADMVGNVCEFTYSILTDYPYKTQDDLENKKKSDRRVTRSTSFHYDGDLGRCAFRDTVGVSHIEDDLGFRVCLAPPFPK